MFQVESKKEMWHDLCQRPLAFRAATNKHVESGLSDKLCQHKDTRAVIFSALNECLIHIDANPSATLCCRRKGYITHYFRTRLYGKEKKNPPPLPHCMLRQVRTTGWCPTVAFTAARHAPPWPAASPRASKNWSTPSKWPECYAATLGLN